MTIDCCKPDWFFWQMTRAHWSNSCHVLASSCADLCNASERGPLLSSARGTKSGGPRIVNVASPHTPKGDSNRQQCLLYSPQPMKCVTLPKSTDCCSTQILCSFIGIWKVLEPVVSIIRAQGFCTTRNWGAKKFSFLDVNCWALFNFHSLKGDFLEACMATIKSWAIGSPLLLLRMRKNPTLFVGHCYCCCLRRETRRKVDLSVQDLARL